MECLGLTRRTIIEHEQSHMVRCDWMDGSRLSAGGLRNGFLQEVGRKLNSLSTPQHYRQSVSRGEHNILPSLSFGFCEFDLDGNSRFFDRNQ